MLETKQLKLEEAVFMMVSFFLMNIGLRKLKFQNAFIETIKKTATNPGGVLGSLLTKTTETISGNDAPGAIFDDIQQKYISPYDADFCKDIESMLLAHLSAAKVEALEYERKRAHASNRAWSNF